MGASARLSGLRSLVAGASRCAEAENSVASRRVTEAAARMSRGPSSRRSSASVGGKRPMLAPATRTASLPCTVLTVPASLTSSEAVPVTWRGTFASAASEARLTRSTCASISMGEVSSCATVGGWRSNASSARPVRTATTSGSVDARSPNIDAWRSSRRAASACCWCVPPSTATATSPTAVPLTSRCTTLDSIVSSGIAPVPPTLTRSEATPRTSSGGFSNTAVTPPLASCPWAVRRPATTRRRSMFEAVTSTDSGATVVGGGQAVGRLKLAFNLAPSVLRST